MLPIFDHQGNRLSVGIKSGVGGMAGDTTSLRLALYEGSPRVLFSLTHPIAGKCGLKNEMNMFNHGCSGYKPWVVKARPLTPVASHEIRVHSVLY